MSDIDPQEPELDNMVSAALTAAVIFSCVMTGLFFGVVFMVWRLA